MDAVRLAKIRAMRRNKEKGKEPESSAPLAKGKGLGSSIASGGTGLAIPRSLPEEPRPIPIEMPVDEPLEVPIPDPVGASAAVPEERVGDSRSKGERKRKRPASEGRATGKGKGVAGSIGSMESFVEEDTSDILPVLPPSSDVLGDSMWWIGVDSTSRFREQLVSPMDKKRMAAYHEEYGTGRMLRQSATQVARGLSILLSAIPYDDKERRSKSDEGLRKKCAELESVIGSLNKELVEEKTARARLEEAHASRLSEVEGELVVALKDVSVLTVRIGQREEVLKDMGDREEAYKKDVAEKETMLAAKEAELAAKDAELAAKNAALAEKEAALVGKDTLLREKDAQLLALAQERDEVDVKYTESLEASFPMYQSGFDEAVRQLQHFNPGADSSRLRTDYTLEEILDGTADRGDS